MRSLRFIYSSVPSKCCDYRALLVQSRDGGFVSRNCLKCGKPGYVNQSQLPDLTCDFCASSLHIQKLDGTNYHYVCSSCDRYWMLANVLPHWTDLFEYSGLAAHGDAPL
jgi:hypothetical protein